MPAGAARAARLATALLALLLVSDGSAAGEAARLDAGEVLIEVATDPRTGVHSARARWVIEGPPEAVWEIVSDCSRYRETMILIKSSVELERRGDTVVCRTVGELPWPLPDPVATVRARQRVDGARWRRSWELVDGDFEVNDGSWILARFESDPERTLVEYRTRMKPSFPLPGWALRWAHTRELPSLAAHLRAQVRTGARGSTPAPEGENGAKPAGQDDPPPPPHGSRSTPRRPGDTQAPGR